MEHSQIILNKLQEENISPYRLAKDTGISESLFSKWKKNPTSEISSSTLALISEYLGCSVDSLLGQEEESKRVEGFLPERLQEVLGNMSSEELTRRFHYKPKVISDYLKGKRKPLNATLFQIAKELGVNPEWLYGLDAPKYEKPAPEGGDGLNEKDVRLIAWFRSLPPEKRKAILMLGEAPEGLDE